MKNDLEVSLEWLDLLLFGLRLRGADPELYTLRESEVITTRVDPHHSDFLYVLPLLVTQEIFRMNEHFQGFGTLISLCC